MHLNGTKLSEFRSFPQGFQPWSFWRHEALPPVSRGFGERWSIGLIDRRAPWNPPARSTVGRAVRLSLVRLLSSRASLRFTGPHESITRRTRWQAPSAFTAHNSATLTRSLTAGASCATGLLRSAKFLLVQDGPAASLLPFTSRVIGHLLREGRDNQIA